jgi:hypothetical protein
MAIGGCPVAPCGRAWQHFKRTPPPGQDSTYFFADLIHPNERGQKLNSYCFYATLTGKPPVGINFTIGNLAIPRTIDSLMQHWAWYYADAWMKSHPTTVRPQPPARKMRQGSAHSSGLTPPRVLCISRGARMRPVSLGISLNGIMMAINGAALGIGDFLLPTQP